MATLTGQQIDASYLGLLKTDDNGVVGAIVKPITDGGGNAINLSIGTGDINFTGGNVDFTAATVTGLAAAGLITGTALNAMRSSASLTTTAAVASGINTIAIGENAQAYAESQISIGKNTTHAAGPVFHVEHAIAIGEDASTSAISGIAIGYNSYAYGGNNSGAVAIGKNTLSNGQSVAIALGAIAEGPGAIAIGHIANASVGAHLGVAVGYNTVATNQRTVAIGYNATASGERAVAIGEQSFATALGAIALGRNVVAATADYTTTQNLQLTNYAALNFADDTAAAAGGVPLGGSYHNAGAARIRIV